jgi:hypothetical protein
MNNPISSILRITISCLIICGNFWEQGQKKLYHPYVCTCVCVLIR